MKKSVRERFSGVGLVAAALAAASLVVAATSLMIAAAAVATAAAAACRLQVFGRYVAYRNDLDLEIEGLAGHRMVEVHFHGLFAHLLDGTAKRMSSASLPSTMNVFLGRSTIASAITSP